MRAATIAQRPRSRRAMTVTMAAAATSAPNAVVARRFSSTPAWPMPPIEPADPTDAMDPADPTERMEPADPIDRMEPTDPIDRIEPTDPIDRIDPIEAVERTLRIDNTDLIDRIEVPARGGATESTRSIDDGPGSVERCDMGAVLQPCGRAWPWPGSGGDLALCDRSVTCVT